MCGEHFHYDAHVRAGVGSSPRVRGTPKPETIFCKLRGIIPACAGNTSSTTPSPRPNRDHPRVCGEHLDDKTLYARQQGSSPRVRGTPRPPSNALNPTGIIPACAGNTSRMQSRAQAPRDHPRVCGEHTTTATGKLADQGSSPRVRGTQRLVRAPRPEQGIIPACAGNTSSFAKSHLVAGDHPRVCGEHGSRSTALRLFLGSSPRVRGTPCRCAGALRRPGIIPACAGNTRRYTMFSSLAWDHPRVCGEHCVPTCA